MTTTETNQREKKIIIISGPNGAGKTTFAGEFLPKEAHCPTFINADLIAAGLAPFEPERAAFRAGRLMLEEIYNHSRRGKSFAFETTLSGRGYAGLIPGWCAKGYIVKLFFSGLPRRNSQSPVSGSGSERVATTFPNLSFDGVSHPGSPILRTSTNLLSMSGRSMTIPAPSRYLLKKE